MFADDDGRRARVLGPRRFPLSALQSRFEDTRAPGQKQPNVDAADGGPRPRRSTYTGITMADDLTRADVPTLLATLRLDDPTARDRATAELWERWFDEKGPDARRRLEYGTTLLSVERFAEALAVFEHLLGSHPDFAEAHNKRATVLFLMRRYEDARAECLETLRLNDTHFGAWQGLGLCEMELGHFLAAARAFERALAIQPHTPRNREFLDRCRQQIN